VENLVVEVGVVEQGLGGNTADIQAGTAELSALLDTSSLPGCSVSKKVAMIGSSQSRASKLRGIVLRTFRPS
jgi:hypothetical protein